jgi:hypothetical protein
MNRKLYFVLLLFIGHICQFSVNCMLSPKRHLRECFIKSKDRLEDQGDHGKLTEAKRERIESKPYNRNGQSNLPNDGPDRFIQNPRDSLELYFSNFRSNIAHPPHTDVDLSRPLKGFVFDIKDEEKPLREILGHDSNGLFAIKKEKEEQLSDDDNEEKDFDRLLQIFDIDLSSGEENSNEDVMIRSPSENRKLKRSSP